MSAAKDPYVRVFYRIIDDPKFATVYGDDRRLSTWLRLLLTADAMYPATAPVPMGVHRPTLAHLVEVGLVDLLPADRYRVHGMAAVRDAASQQGRDLASMRWRNAEPHSEPAMRKRTTGADALNSTQLNSAQLRSVSSTQARDFSEKDREERLALLNDPSTPETLKASIRRELGVVA